MQNLDYQKYQQTLLTQKTLQWRQSDLGLSVTSQDPTAPGSLTALALSGHITALSCTQVPGSDSEHGCVPRALCARLYLAPGIAGALPAGAGSGPAGSSTGRANAELFAWIYGEVLLVAGKGYQLNPGRGQALCVQGSSTMAPKPLLFVCKRHGKRKVWRTTRSLGGYL